MQSIFNHRKSKWFRVRRNTWLRLEFKWEDLWIGAFISRKHFDSATEVYICPLPTLVLHFRKVD